MDSGNLGGEEEVSMEKGWEEDVFINQKIR